MSAGGKTSIMSVSTSMLGNSTVVGVLKIPKLVQDAPHYAIYRLLAVTTSTLNRLQRSIREVFLIVL